MFQGGKQGCYPLNVRHFLLSLLCDNHNVSSNTASCSEGATSPDACRSSLGSYVMQHGRSHREIPWHGRGRYYCHMKSSRPSTGIVLTLANVMGIQGCPTPDAWSYRSEFLALSLAV
jgi:hypothetical protein